MENKNIILNYLKRKDYNLEEKDVSNGIDIILNDNEVVIKGTKLDLIELADLLVTVALSDGVGNHIHIDDLTLLNTNSEIKSIIVEQK